MPDEREAELGGGAQQDASAIECTTLAEAASLPEWAEQAWRAWCRGQKNKSALARQFGVSRETITRNLEKFSRLVRLAADSDGVDVWQQAVVGQEEILSEAWRVHADPGATNFEKLKALQVAAAAIEQIAGLNGVVTRRQGVALGGDPNAPPIGIRTEGEEIDELRQLLADRRTRRAARRGPGSDPVGVDSGAEAEPAGPVMGGSGSA